MKKHTAKELIKMINKIDIGKFEWNEEQKHKLWFGFHQFEEDLPSCYNKADDSNYCKGGLFPQEFYENGCEDCVRCGTNN